MSANNDVSSGRNSFWSLAAILVAIICLLALLVELNMATLDAHASSHFIITCDAKLAVIAALRAAVAAVAAAAGSELQHLPLTPVMSPALSFSLCACSS